MPYSLRFQRQRQNNISQVWYKESAPPHTVTEQKNVKAVYRTTFVFVPECETEWGSLRDYRRALGFKERPVQGKALRSLFSPPPSPVSPSSRPLSPCVAPLTSFWTSSCYIHCSPLFGCPPSSSPFILAFSFHLVFVSLPQLSTNYAPLIPPCSIALTLLLCTCNL